MSSAFAVLMALPLLVVSGETKIIDGELRDDDPRHSQREAPMDTHEFETDQRQLLTVLLRPASSDAPMDTYLFLTGPSGQAYSNDDSPDGKGGSMLQIVTPEEGLWEVIVTGYGKDVRGRYRLKLKTQDLKRLIHERGELAEDDQLSLKGGERVDVVDLDVKAGKTYVAQMVSGAFDSYLTVHVDNEVLSNDDAPGLSNGSQLIFTPAADGKAKLVLTSTSRTGLGRYVMMVYEADESIGSGEEEEATAEAAE